MTHKLQTWEILKRQVFYRGTSCKLAPASVFDKKGKEMYFVADQLFVKYDEFGEIQDIIIIENKLSFNTDLTSNQKAAKKINTYKVRNTDSKTSEFNSGRLLNNNTDPLIFNGQIKWYKVWDHDTGDIINDISKI